MKTFKVETVKDHTYGGQKRKPGDCYDCEERFLQAVVGMGWAKKVEEPEPSSQAERKGTYKRRDMKAEK